MPRQILSVLLASSFAALSFAATAADTKPLLSIQPAGPDTYVVEANGKEAARIEAKSVQIVATYESSYEKTVRFAVLQTGDAVPGGCSRLRVLDLQDKKAPRLSPVLDDCKTLEPFDLGHGIAFAPRPATDGSGWVYDSKKGFTRHPATPTADLLRFAKETAGERYEESWATYWRIVDEPSGKAAYEIAQVVEQGTGGRTSDPKGAIPLYQFAADRGFAAARARLIEKHLLPLGTFGSKPEDFDGNYVTMYFDKKSVSFLDLPPVRDQMKRLLGPDAHKAWKNVYSNGVSRDGVWFNAWGAEKVDPETNNRSIFYDPAGRLLSCETSVADSKEPQSEIRNGVAYSSKASSDPSKAKVVLRGTDHPPVEFQIESFNCPSTFDAFEQAYKGTKRETFKW